MILSTKTQILLLILSANALAILGDIFIKKAVDNNIKPYVGIVICAVLYAATAPLWYNVFRRMSFTSLVYYWPTYTILYMLTGFFIIGDRPKAREWIAIALNFMAKFIGG